MHEGGRPRTREVHHTERDNARERETRHARGTPRTSEGDHARARETTHERGTPRTREGHHARERDTTHERRSLRQRQGECLDSKLVVTSLHFSSFRKLGSLTVCLCLRCLASVVARKSLCHFTFKIAAKFHCKRSISSPSYSSVLFKHVQRINEISKFR